MSRYKILIGGQLYQIAMSDATKYYVQDGDVSPTEDIITYRVELDEQNPYQGTIYASITNPSAHTQYLMSQGKCYIAVNGRNFSQHSRHRDNYQYAHQSVRCSAIYHKRWSICAVPNSLLNNLGPIKVTNCNNIELPIHFQWSQDDCYNVRGFKHILHLSDQHQHPGRSEFYFDIRLALLSKYSKAPSSVDASGHRVYQTNSQITRITFHYK